MKYKVHRFDIKMDTDQARLEQFLNNRGSGIPEYIHYFLIYEIVKVCIYKKFIYKPFN